MKQLLERFFGGKDSEGSKRPSKKTGYMIILGIAGLFLLILSNIFSSSPSEGINDQEIEKMETAKETSQQEAPTTTSIDELESLYKKDLESMLNKITGVSEAEVMVNLESTSVKVYEKNLIKGQQSTDESDKNGGERKVEDQTEEVQTVLVRQGDREVPLLIQTKKPQVRGVFVVAKGADHATVKKWMIESISRVLDVPKHRVSVMPKN
ncbi:stage III sporulation protein AG [Virgibacillus halodenitrificans]|uniref:Stage III sporulation protein AG n=1 Tax=Virgibacillus halodenitrificans TaxID=1482 RepID=A0AAC9IZ96_VIRHA|nr:stage III sporulation protein AG [Virgibacillus halodenitrificans]APC48332.1 stage III sporulation protein AG [Virgibacillus halodenitrificans]MEC2158400.1 stage III sporulation protein AG [Virgibacillus halodenitrificans]WHX27478.1 stage III sporulation protein AG [Virgibacillus halodenitrificans]CDQ35532.1 stage III sporulation protein AG [Virgibacillus halodenitrificans]